MKNMKNKLIVLFLTAFFGIYLLSADHTNASKKIEPSTMMEKHSDKFKQDMLESIMEFADDDTSADSLYIPDWIMQKD
jgi:hypothetical protein